MGAPSTRDMTVPEGAREARGHDGEDGAGVGVRTGDGGGEGALERDHEGDERSRHERGVEAPGEERLEGRPAEDEDGVADGIAESDEGRDAAGGHIRGETEQASHDVRAYDTPRARRPRGQSRAPPRLGRASMLSTFSPIRGDGFHRQREETT